MSRVMVAADAFAGAVEQVLRAVSRDPKQPVLQCVLIEAGDGSLRLVSTDRLRLVVCELPVLDGAAASFRALVPAGALESIDGDQHGTVTAGVDGAGASLELQLGGQTHTLALDRSEFPNYEKFLVADPEAHPLVVDRAALISAIEGLPDGEPLPFRFTEGGLELGDPVAIRLPAVYRGAGISFVLNPAFAHDAAQSAAGPELAIEAASAVSPVVIRSAGDDTYTGIVMPIRTRDSAPLRTRRR
jgi:DNA polymerase III sliding clamp (beta) subunit (PCNA family)